MARPKSSTLCTRESIRKMLKQGKNVTVYYGIVDDTLHHESGLWRVTAEKCELLARRQVGLESKT